MVHPKVESFVVVNTEVTTLAQDEYLHENDQFTPKLLNSDILSDLKSKPDHSHEYERVELPSLTKISSFIFRCP